MTIDDYWHELVSYRMHDAFEMLREPRSPFHFFSIDQLPLAKNRLDTKCTFCYIRCAPIGA